MGFRTETITVLPAIIVFLMASYFAFLTTQFVDPSMQKALVTIALGLFIGGLILTFFWFYYWGIHKRFQDNEELTYSYE